MDNNKDDDQPRSCRSRLTKVLHKPEGENKNGWAELSEG